MADYLPTQEQKLLAWLNNFVPIATTNHTTLGLSTTDTGLIAGDYADLSEALSNVATARAAYEGAVIAKDATMGRVTQDVRAVVKRIQNQAGVPDALKGQLGITVPSGTRTKTAPVTPSDVLATPQASGVNTLAWDVTGNKATTQYVILAKTLTNGQSALADTGWSIIGQTTRSRFEHMGVMPGVPMAYKVMAARAGQSSQPSMPAVVYGG